MNISTYIEMTTDIGMNYIQRTDEDGKVWAIPNDPTNSDYQAYLASLEAPQG